MLYGPLDADLLLRLQQQSVHFRFVTGRHVMPTRKYSLLYVEDDSLWQSAVALALKGMPEIASITTARDATSALASAEMSHPDIVLLDLVLPDMDGLALALKLAQMRQAPRIIVLSARRDSVILNAASQPHISGLIWKSAHTFSELSRAITHAVRGEKYYPEEVRAALRRFRADPIAFFKILSARELELLPLVGGGRSDEEIATLLGLSAHTVRSHRQHIMRKLGLPTAARLVHWAILQGFVPSLAVREDEDAYG